MQFFEQQYIYHLLQAPENNNTPFQAVIRIVLDNGEVYSRNRHEFLRFKIHRRV
ncbi:MAG: hypothetical protein ACJAUH_002436 [Saprospiraceae bacterium]|jgi:hypothetical protein